MVHQCKKLHGIHGFSPYQLPIGKNPKLPSTLNEKAPSLTHQPESKIVSSNLDAIHRAREGFIASENFEKIKRALSHNIRTSGDVKYITGDSVYYISAWAVENYMDQPKYLAKMAKTDKCLSKVSTLVAFNLLIKTAKTTKMH